jgi:hypothetical protein
MFTNKTLDKVCWERYAQRNLWKMIAFLEKGDHSFEEAICKQLVELIRAHLLLRSRVISSKVKSGKPSMSIEWTSQLLRVIPLGSVLKSTVSKQLFPASMSWLEDVSIARRLVQPLGRTIFNYSTTARKLCDLDATEAECKCREIFDILYRPFDGCVLTGDLNIVNSASLQRILRLGPKVRLHVSADPIEAIKIALDEYISKVSESEAIAKVAFLDWKHAILNACETRLKAANVRGNDSNTRTVVMGSKDLDYLKFLQNHLVLVPVDKAANNIAFVCKRLYTNILRKELDSEPDDVSEKVYEISDEGSEVVLARHEYHLRSFYGMENTPKKLGYLYWMPKLHKIPCSERFIAAAFNCTTTQLSKLLSDCLTHILNTLRAKDDAHITRTAIRRFFVVSGYEEVVAFLSKWPRGKYMGGSQQLHTGDFSTMYTTIPHADLIKRLSGVLDEVWEWVSITHDVGSDPSQHNRTMLRWSSGKCDWEFSRARIAMFSHSSHVHKFTKKELLDAIAWLVGNTFLVNGGVCRRQIRGIPMGTNCGPSLSNLYLYSYESTYIDKLIENNQLDIAKEFHMTFRLIDDLLSADNKWFLEAISRSFERGGIYPSALALNDTSISCTEVRFLGMSIRDIGCKLCFDVFDKRREFPFTVCRYPHKSSLIPAYIAYGVFTGLLHRYYRICTQFEHFCWNAALLSRTLIAQGWSSSRLRTIFRKFLQSRLAIKWKQPLGKMCMEFATQSNVIEN